MVGPKAVSEPAAIFQHLHRIAFHEVDAGGRLFGGRIFELFVTAYHAFLCSRGFDLRELDKLSVRLPLVHIEADFVAAMPFATELLVELIDIKLGTSSLTLSFRAVSAAHPEKIHCTGKTVHVFVDRDDNEKRTPPDDIARLFAGTGRIAG
jgi:acyl-CoA thioesterase FadM